MLLCCSLPPRVAPVQVVIVPITSKKCTHSVMKPYCDEILAVLLKAGVKAKFDEREHYNPGWKYK